MANKRKVTTAVVAGATALALILGGTFAWTSISQQARNEAIVDINPGGRLHDDFNGSNKDVYVENFGDELTGVPIYARVRLDQYMEIGQEAGNKDIPNGTRKANIVIGEDINDVTTWIPYQPGTIEDGKIQALDYWLWDMGNDTTDIWYMPTFNLNKDSLDADINGTYEGTVDGDKVHYDDYVLYTDGSTKTSTEIYDWDSDTKDEDGKTPGKEYDNNGVITDDSLPIDAGDVLHRENKEHKAEQLSNTAVVMTMAQWNELSNEEKATIKCWVYDEDGWAYWSQPIEPGETTGLLLNGITMSRVPDDSWYYGINVVGQFATKGDLSAFEADGMSDAAKALLGDAADIEATLTVSGSTAVQPGKTYNYTAAMTKAGMAVATPESLAWSVENIEIAPAEDGTQTTADDVITIADNGTLTIAETVTFDTTFTVVATADGVTGSIDVTVVDSWQSQVDALTPGTTATVEIDGIEWFVLAKEDGKALLQTAEPVGDPTVQVDNMYGERIDYFGGDINQWLNTEGGIGLWDNQGQPSGSLPGFMSQLNDLKSSIVENEIFVIDLYNTGNTYDYSLSDPSLVAHVVYESKKVGVFLPSAADFESLNYQVGIQSEPDKDRTFGDKGLITAEMAAIMLGNTQGGKIPTRSYVPNTWAGYPEYMSAIYSIHGVEQGASGLTTNGIGEESRVDVFPMMWVDYTAE